jgi:hypothetical protein
MELNKYLLQQKIFSVSRIISGLKLRALSSEQMILVRVTSSLECLYNAVKQKKGNILCSRKKPAIGFLCCHTRGSKRFVLLRRRLQISLARC